MCKSFEGCRNLHYKQLRLLCLQLCK
uniref:Uncharacterized protein n=1 Tax=Arundo donax TaxID=35708 RepID=A0A0A8YGJ4_ARUDO